MRQQTDLATRASLAMGLSSPTCSTSLGMLYEAADPGLRLCEPCRACEVGPSDMLAVLELVGMKWLGAL